MMDIESYQPSNRIKALSEQASSIRIDIKIPAKRYFRSSMEMVRMARVYYSEGNKEAAFVLYQKYLSLMLEQLPKHPEYSAVDATLKKSASKQCKETFSVAEEVRDELKAAYEVVYQQQVHAESIRLQQLKLEEARRSEEERRQHEKAMARAAAQEEAKKKQAMEEEDRKYAMYLEQEMRKETERPAPPAEAVAPPLPPPTALPTAPPTAPQPVSVPYPNAGMLPINPPSYGEASNDTSNRTPTVDRSTKPGAHFTQTNNDIVSRPTVDRNTKPGAHFTQTNNDMVSQNVDGLRPLTVPISISQRFAELAKDNTTKDNATENMTCGLLFGKLEQKVFHITHVLVPHQKGAPDSCTMLNEEEIFQFHDNHDLIQLGLIQTHPTQRAFLSSVNLHTQVGQQIMMPEAIVIVVATKFDEVGIFNLTPYGLDYISKCSSQGLHAHPKEPALYQECKHVKMDSTRQPVFVDLR